jgi:hypothetical protein
MAGRKDDCSGGNFNDIDIKHIHIQWQVDFDAKTLKGSAIYTIKAVVKDIKQLVRRFDYCFSTLM